MKLIDLRRYIIVRTKQIHPYSSI